MLLLLWLYYFECRYVTTGIMKVFTVINIIWILIDVQVQWLTLMVVEIFIIVPFPFTNIIHVSWFSPYYTTPVWVLVVMDVVYLGYL
jgi:hypothetical protein